MKLYPAIDVLDGACVRLAKGRFDDRVVYSDNPLETARAFEAAGAEYLHVVDLSGARRTEDRQVALLASMLKATKLAVQVGGGLRTFEDAAELVELGADRVVIGSAAVTQPALVQRLLRELGGAHVTVALDVRVEPGGAARVAVHGWTKESGVSIDQAMEPFLAVGLQRVLCTDIERDGMMSGPNTKLYADLMRRYPGIEFQASGGVATLDDLVALASAGVGSAISGKALYEGAIDLQEALRACGAGARC